MDETRDPLGRKKLDVFVKLQKNKKIAANTLNNLPNPLVCMFKVMYTLLEWRYI